MPEADELVEALGDVFERQRADDEADDDRTFRALVSQRMDAAALPPLRPCQPRRAEAGADDARTFRALVSQRMDAASLPPLRPYQLECARAIADSVVRDRGLSFSVMMARQAGQNETSARLGMMLLAHFTPVRQALLSMRRLEMRLREAGLG